ncbi:NUDIX domain-containing protein [soil metagenome]
MLKKIIGTIWRKMPSYLRKKVIRTTQHTFTVSAAAIITNEDGKVLLLDHVLRTASGWGFPGGFLEMGEQAENALKREIREETGLELKDVKLIRVRTINRHIEILFRAKATGKAEVKSSEIKDVVWFNVDEIPENMSQTQKSIIRKLLKSK